MSEPKRQTIATKKYQEKVGLISKTYKLKKSIVDEFKQACDSNGESQAEVLTRFMKQYIEDSKN